VTDFYATQQGNFLGKYSDFPSAPANAVYLVDVSLPSTQIKLIPGIGYGTVEQFPTFFRIADLQADTYTLVPISSILPELIQNNEIGPLKFTLNGVYSSAGVPSELDPPVPYAGPAATIKRCRLIRRTAGTAGETALNVRVIRVVSSGPVSFDIFTPDSVIKVAASSGDRVTATKFPNIPGPGIAPIDTSVNGSRTLLLPGDIVEAVLTSVETFKPGPPDGPEGAMLYIEFNDSMI
jgi:hypothetical protein